MQEDFLHHVWQFKKWDDNLFTTQGELIKVLSPGTLNTNAGPDFLNAKLKINDVVWVGNIEIHTKSSDWNVHQHQSDKNYDNIILHVVYENDSVDNLGNFPTLILKNSISLDLLKNYKNLEKPYQFIPCEESFKSVDSFIKKSYYESLYIERLSNKSDFWQQRLDLLLGDWEALLFEGLAYGFGLKINAQPFHQLAKSFDFKVLKSVIRKGESVESLLFGQAGFLEKPKDNYQNKLKNDYEILKNKYGLESIENHLFKFLRLRPPNFPTIRLAQLSALYNQNYNWFQHLIVESNYKEIDKKLTKINTKKYWESHYIFGKESPVKKKKISANFIHLLYINVLLPIKFLYNQKTGKNLDELLNFASQLKVESNSIIQKFKQIDDLKLNMIDGQALLELKNNFCDAKKCLNCTIGNQIIK